MTNTEKILKTLSYKYAKGGLTSAQIADRANLKANSARTTLYELTQSGAVERIGAEKAAGRGRPAYLYVAA